MGQVVACSPVTQRARVRSPVGTSFLGEVFSGFFLTYKTNFRKLRPPRSPNIIWPSLSSSIIIHYGRQWPEMLTRPKTICNTTLETAWIITIFNEKMQTDTTITTIHTRYPISKRVCLRVCKLYSWIRLFSNEFATDDGSVAYPMRRKPCFSYKREWGRTKLVCFPVEKKGRVTQVRPHKSITFYLPFTAFYIHDDKNKHYEV